MADVYDDDYAEEWEEYMDAQQEAGDGAKMVPAEGLPEGWYWQMYNDGSGCLKSPVKGVDFFQYDHNTGEIKDIDSFWTGMDEDGLDFEYLEGQIVSRGVLDAMELSEKMPVAFSPLVNIHSVMSAVRDSDAEWVAVSPSVAVPREALNDVWKQYAATAEKLGDNGKITPLSVTGRLRVAVERGDDFIRVFPGAAEKFDIDVSGLIESAVRTSDIDASGQLAAGAQNPWRADAEPEKQVVVPEASSHGSSSRDEMAARMRDVGYDEWEIREEIDLADWAEKNRDRNTVELATEGKLSHVQPEKQAEGNKYSLGSMCKTASEAKDAQVAGSGGPSGRDDR